MNVAPCLLNPVLAPHWSGGAGPGMPPAAVPGDVEGHSAARQGDLRPAQCAVHVWLLRRQDGDLELRLPDREVGLARASGFGMCSHAPLRSCAARDGSQLLSGRGRGRERDTSSGKRVRRMHGGDEPVALAVLDLGGMRTPDRFNRGREASRKASIRPQCPLHADPGIGVAVAAFVRPITYTRVARQKVRLCAICSSEGRLTQDACCSSTTERPRRWSAGYCNARQGKSAGYSWSKSCGDTRRSTLQYARLGAHSAAARLRPAIASSLKFGISSCCA
jgi:hypothetical protein